MKSQMGGAVLRVERMESRDLPGFLSPLNYPVPSTQYGTRIIDVSGDRKPDAVVAAYSLNSIAVFRGDGTGRLTNAVYHAVGNSPTEIEVVDLNHDAKLDIISANGTHGSAPTLTVLLGEGGGKFQPPAVTPLSAGTTHFTVGDFNRDGQLDLATCNGNQNVIGLWKGNGDGTFQAPSLYPNGPSAWGIRAADFNGDGWPDVTTVNPNAGTINVILNRGDGTLLAPTAYAAGIKPFAVFAGDMNADGRPDIVSPDFNGNSLKLFFANPDGTLQPMVSLPCGPLPFYPRLGDFNRDGRVDIATPQYGNSTVGIFMGNGDGTFAPHLEFGVGKGDLRTMEVGDLNNDRFTDVIVPTGTGNGGFLNVLRNDALWPPPAPPAPRHGVQTSFETPAASDDQDTAKTQPSIDDMETTADDPTWVPATVVTPRSQTPLWERTAEKLCFEFALDAKPSLAD